MNRALRFELLKLWRRRTVLIALAVTSVFAVGSAALLLASAGPAKPGRGGPGLTIDELDLLGMPGTLVVENGVPAFTVER